MDFICPACGAELRIEITFKDEPDGLYAVPDKPTLWLHGNFEQALAHFATHGGPNGGDGLPIPLSA